MLRTDFPAVGIHVDDHRIIHKRLNDVVNVRDFGAIGDKQNDDTAAFQAAIRDCLDKPDSDPITTVRVAQRPLFIPPGHYLLSSELSLESISCLMMSGCGRSSALYFSGNPVAGLHLNGIESCVFRDLAISTMPDAMCDKVIWYEWSGVKRSSTNNRFYNIEVNGRFQRGIQIGGDGGFDQEDQTYWYGCRVTGKWLPGEESLWQDGWRVGSGVFGNNLCHSIYGIASVGNRYGINLNASQLAVYGGIIQSNEVDLFLSGLTSYFYVSGIRSESSASFLQTHGAVTYAANVSISDCLYNVPTAERFDPDQRWITYHYPGTLYLRNVVCRGNAGTGILPKIFVNPVATYATTVIADGLTVADCSPQQAFELVGLSTAFIRGYSSTTAGGRQSSHTTEMILQAA